jgi:radical SAM superfamily enzyme YgiQ (UPF0313 family)
MKSHVLMVHVVTGATVSYSHGLASLAGVMLANGHAPSDLNLVTVRSDDMNSAAEQMISMEPSIILVSAMSNQWERVKTLASCVKRLAPQIPLCIGGSHVTAAPKTVSDSCFDICVAGEAEGVITPIVTGGPLDIESVVRRFRNLNLMSGMIENLDDLPMPVLQLFDKTDVLQYPSVMFSRGCPYKCTYCMSRLGGVGGRIRWKSPERAIRETIQLLEFAQPEEIYIDDDTLLKNPLWVKAFCRLYRERVSIPFFCNARPETIRPEVVQYLKEANCSAIGIGIESGSARIRRDVLGREMSDETIVRAFEVAHAAGLKTWSFNMVGLPSETPEDLQATIELNDRVKTEFIRVSIFTPYPGTPVYDTLKHLSYNRSYIRASKDIPDGLQQLYVQWVSRLDKEGRLWFTESEHELSKDPASVALR